MGKNVLKRLVHFICMMTLIGVWYYATNRETQTQRILGSYGLLMHIVVGLLCLQQLLVFPHAICNFLGFFLFNNCPSDVEVNVPFDSIPFICIRVVTSESDAELVGKTVQRNLDVCFKAGLQNFAIDIVTEKELHLPKQDHVTEVVVPVNYSTKNGTMFKSRNLQFCLDNEIHELRDDDWLVHLDEKTTLTESSLKGIVNFILEDKHKFGKGAVSVNPESAYSFWISLFDLNKIVEDHGQQQFQLRALRCPYFGWKKSFMVCKVGAEKKISFDHGLDYSLSEDFLFGLMDNQEGFTCGFVEGEAHECGFHSVEDFFKHKKRWKLTSWMAATSPLISFTANFYLVFIAYLHLTLPLSLLSGVLLGFFFTPNLFVVRYCLAFVNGAFTYFYFLGGFKALSAWKVAFVKWPFYLVVMILTIPVLLALDCYSSLSALFSLFKREQIYVDLLPKTQRKLH